MASRPVRGVKPKTDDADAVARAERMRQAADNAAGLVRPLFFGFIALGAYIGMTITSTTDAQLLKIDPVQMPLLNVPIPIVGFYAVAPWLFVLAHFNLLLQFQLLSRKLHAFEAALQPLGEAARAEQRDQLFPLAFVQMLAGDHNDRLMRTLLGVMIWATTIALPPVMLIWAEVRFLPFQSTLWTCTQRAAVTADVVLLLVLWPSILTDDGSIRTWWIQLRSLELIVLRLAAALVQSAATRWPRLVRVGRMTTLLASWERYQGTLSSLPRGAIMLGATILPVAVFYALLVTDTLPTWWPRRYLDVSSAVLVRDDPPADVVELLKNDNYDIRQEAYRRVLAIITLT